MLELLRENWAFVAASVLVTALALQGLFVLLSRTPTARLNKALATLETKRREGRKIVRRMRRAERRCARLEGKATSVRPIKLEEARDDLSDCEALLKIARDQALIAENRVRQVIVEQFPPSRQEKLRRRCGVDEAPSDKPF